MAKGHRMCELLEALDHPLGVVAHVPMQDLPASCGVVAMLIPLVAGAQSPAPERAIVEADKFLASLDLKPPQSPSWLSATRLAKGGATPLKVEALLGSVLERCLASSEACPESDWHHRDPSVGRRGDAARTLLGLFGIVGTRDSLPLLYRLEVRGFLDAGQAREAVLRRELVASVGRARCVPTKDELRAARARLDDFAVLRLREGRLIAQRPTDSELDDLGYFLAAAPEAGAPIGESQEQAADTRSAAQKNPPLDAAYKELTQAQMRGDLRGVDAAARRYLTLLGYPGPLKTFEENHHGWHSSRFSRVMREWAKVKELLGEPGAAAELYQRAHPNDGICGTGADLVLQAQFQGFIRTKERQAGCRAVLPERLLEQSGPGDEGAYGPARLRNAGFEVARLYRGALVTLNRDIPPAELERILAQADEPLRSKALQRLRKLGPEAWEARVHALEGVADTLRKASIDLLLQAVSDGGPEARRRALAALGRLVERTPWDVCKGELGGAISSNWSRPIEPLATKCGRALEEAERRVLAGRLIPFLASTDGTTRAATADALGRLGTPAARDALAALSTDPFTSGYYLGETPGVETPIYPVREAAARGLALLDKFERKATNDEDASEGD